MNYLSSFAGKQARQKDSSFEQGIPDLCQTLERKHIGSRSRERRQKGNTEVSPKQGRTELRKIKATWEKGMEDKIERASKCK